jgi:CMP-N-acetylneuraminic acid synthetase
MESVIAIIPARGGSKRLPGKNLMQLDGVSLLARTIQQAREIFQITIVSSDDWNILEEAGSLGVNILKRPAILATDTATSAEVVSHALSLYPGFKWFCLLQVTSPLRSQNDILACLDMADSSGEPVISTCNGLPNGAVYVWPTDRFKGDFATGALHHEMPPERSLDIDTLEDFEKAEDYIMGPRKVFADGHVGRGFD